MADRRASSVVEEFRAAVASGEFRRAEQLWRSYMARCRAEESSSRAEQLREIRDLMEWTRVTVLCFRAQALRKLKTRVSEVHAAGAYARAGRSPR